MQVPFDGAALAQTLSSQLHVSPDAASQTDVDMDRGAQDMTTRLKPDEGQASSPCVCRRTRSGPRAGRNPRPASPVTGPRASWTWPGTSILTQPSQISRRQSPGRFRGLSRSISPRRTLAADYRYQGLIQKARLFDAVNEAPMPGLQGDIIPSFGMHSLRGPEEYWIPVAQPIHGVNPWDVPEITAHQETADDQLQDDSDDSILDEFDPLEEEPSHLDPDHRLWGIKDSLVHHSQAQFVESSQSIQEETQGKQWKYIFACPFFRKDPARYWSCLADTSMVTMRGLKRHLWRNHSQPYYCPVCYDVFPLASKRDAHITQRTCEKREVMHFDGMTPEQKTLISVRCKGNSGAEQWRSIWKILFGRPLGMLDPFLTPELSGNVMRVTEFWKAKGREITEQFLGDLEMVEDRLSCQVNDDSSISGLMNVVLQDMVGLVWRSELARNLANIPALGLAV